MRYLALLVFLTGCMSVSQPETFKLETGETVTCYRYEQSECGIHLFKCGADKKGEYKCVTKVFYEKTAETYLNEYSEPSTQEKIVPAEDIVEPEGPVLEEAPK